jgi:hypothetical protein
MSRTPTFVRLNLDEIVAMNIDPAAYGVLLSSNRQALLIEDDRAKSQADIPAGWYAIATKVRLGGKTIKDNTAPIDPTERRGIGAFG